MKDIPTIIGAIVIYSIGFSIMMTIGDWVVSATHDYTWGGIFVCCAFLNLPIFAIIYFAGKAIYLKIKGN